MSKLTDVSAIIISIIGTGAVLAMLILTGLSGIKGDIYGIKDDIYQIRGEMNQMRGDIADLQQRTARIEGQLTLLVEAWNTNMPTVPVIIDK